MSLSISMSNNQNTEAIVVLDNIRSVHNVGSIFRTSETLGISKIFCIGTTPIPTDRFGNKRADFAKVSLGAENSLKWEYVENEKSVELIKKLKKGGSIVISLEQDEKSVDYKEVAAMLQGFISQKKQFKQAKQKSTNVSVAIIFGNEVDGVSQELLKLSDLIAEIPMRGKKESLNVSVSAGIFLYRLLDN